MLYRVILHPTLSMVTAPPQNEYNIENKMTYVALLVAKKDKK